METVKTAANRQKNRALISRRFTKKPIRRNNIQAMHKPVVAKPVEKPVEIVISKPVANPVETVISKPVAKPVETAIAKPVETVVANPVSNHQLPPLGIIILRCVKRPQYANHWITCYKQARSVYPTIPIMIIDDHSTANLIKDVPLENCTIVHSEYSGAAELLFYYYFWKRRPFQKAILIHDSMFIRKKIAVESVTKLRFLWHFTVHHEDNVAMETNYLSMMENNERLLQIYRQKNWWGCFGVASVCSLNFIDHLQNKYKLFNIIGNIRFRKQRFCIERVFAVLAFAEGAVSHKNCSFMGDILAHPKTFRHRYEHFISSPNQIDLPIVKTWCGR